MRVAIDATSLGSGLGGDETLLSGILRGLVAVARPDDVFELLLAVGATLPASVESAPGVVVHRRRRRPGVVHFAVELPRWLFGLETRPDVVLSQTHAPARSPAPVALMLPDLSFEHHPEFFPPLTRLRLRTLVKRQAHRAEQVLTISEFSRQDLIDTYGLDPRRVHTVPLIVDEPLSLTAREEATAGDWLRDAGVDSPFVLYLGNLHPRKNVAGALHAFALLKRTRPELARHQFVVAGGRWFSGSDEESAAKDCPAGSVVFVGRVDDGQREFLLRRANALVYVSRFEGFGLPPLEAMARDTPVVASATTSMPEVCGSAAVLVDPHSVEAIADAMASVLLDADRRRRLVVAGRERVAHYNVETTGRAARAALAAATRTTSSVDTPSVDTPSVDTPSDDRVGRRS